MNKSPRLEDLRHSTAHLLAASVMELWPKAKRAIGPSIENGFYFDFDFSPVGADFKLSEKDFTKIEQKMRELLKNWNSFEKEELTAKEAKSEYPDNEFKHELIDEFSENGKVKVSFYKSGGYKDLCKGGHVDNPKEMLKHFKLLSIAGAYWRGDEKNKMLTRIYGTTFESKEKLDQYLWQMAEAKKRDHRKLGQDLDLFVFSDLVGSGLPLYTPKGALVRRLLQEHVNNLQKEIGYEEAWTPQLAKADLFKTSGHYDKYKDDMFRVSSNYSDEEYFLKPMNCPNHCVLYQSKPRSYRDLPIRYSDFANLFRDEKPGELMGLTRLRFFSQDDGHCFCREDQIEKEFTSVMRVVDKALEVFKIKYWIRLSLWDPKDKDKYLGEKSVWEKAQEQLENILIKNKVKYEKVDGEAAIYGPKMDFIAVDSLGREWQISTIQLDLIMAQRFGLTYADKDGTNKTPVMIHRAVLGSPERFIGIILEHLNGALPVWLSPVQIAVLPITNDQDKYATQVVQKLKMANLRVELWNESESLQKRIRNAEKLKIPYMLIIGQREVEAGSVSVRQHGEKDMGTMAVTDFMATILSKIENKSLN